MQHLAHDDTTRSIQSWTLSTFIHGLAFGAALMALSDLPKPVQRESFSWAISLVTPSPRPIPGPGTDALSTHQVAQATQASSQMAETPHFRRERVREIVRQEPDDAVSFVQGADPVIQQSQQVVGHIPSPLTSHQPVSVETPATSTALPGGADRAAESAMAQVDKLSPFIPHQALQEQTTLDIIDDPTDPPSANHSASLSTLQAPIFAQAEAGDRSALPPTHPAGPRISSAQEALSSIHDTPVTTVAMPHPPIGRLRPFHPDYGWLTDSLRRRVESLKTYPRLARVQGWEGRVVVLATIKDDGNLLDAVVTESSGYASLDEEALQLMQRACPIRLQRDLGQSHIEVLIPVHYRLDR